MYRAKFLFGVLFLLGTLFSVATADQLAIEGSSVAEPGDEIVLLIPPDVSREAFLVVLHNSEVLPSDDFSFSNSLLLIERVKEGQYQVIVKHEDGHLTKLVRVGTTHTRESETPVAAGRELAEPTRAHGLSFVSAVADSESSLTKALNDVKEKEPEKFSGLCRKLSEAADHALDDPKFLNKPHKTLADKVSAAVKDSLGEDEFKIETAFVKALKDLGGEAYEPSEATAEVVKGIATKFKEELAQHIEETSADEGSSETGGSDEETMSDKEEELAAALFPKDFEDGFAEAIKARMFALRVNDFDPDFQKTSKRMADEIEKVIKKKSIKDVKEFRQKIAEAVKEVIKNVSGTDVGEAKKRWKNFYIEYAVLLYVLEVEKSQRTAGKRKKYFDRFQTDLHQYKSIVTTSQTFERQIEKQRRAFKIFVAALNKAIDRDKVEVENALKKAGVRSPSAQAAGRAGTGSGYAGTVLGRMHQRKMTRMYYHHKQRMARIRGY